MNKEELLKEKERIMKNIKNRENRIALIDEELKKIEELNNKKWKPKIGEEYYFIASYKNQVYKYFFCNDSIDNDCLLIGNYFKTKEEAEFEIERLKVLKELKEFSYDFSDEELKDEEINKYVIFFDFRFDDIRIGIGLDAKVDIDLFKSEEDCKKAIEKIGDARLKKYFFKVGVNK